MPQPQSPQLISRSTATPFVGLGQELEQATRWLDAPSSCLCVLGAPGVGKTRFVLHALTSHKRADDAVIVSLGHAQDLAHIKSALLSALAAQSIGGELDEALATLEDSPHGLLVLDGIEHVQELCEQLILQLLQDHPALPIITTTRRRPRLKGAQCIELSPLEPAQAASLFITCAQRHRHDWSCSPAETSLLATLCQRLGHLPLAIELAASRITMFSLSQLVERLEQDLSLLKQRVIDAPEHHGSMERAIAWSWRLLDPETQHALGLLSVFKGSFTLEAAEFVLDDLTTLDPLELVSTLCDHGLLRAFNPKQAPNQVRLELSPLILQFIQSQLPSVDASLERATARHAQHFTTLVERLSAPGAQSLSDFANLGLELDNIFSIYHRFIATDPPRAERITLALLKVIQLQGASKLTQQLTAMSTELISSNPYQASIIQTRAEGSARHGKVDQALTELRHALSMLEQGQAPVLRWSLLKSSAKILARAKRPDEACAIYEQAIQEATQRQDEPTLLQAHMAQASLHLKLARTTQAQDALERAVALAKSLRDDDQCCLALYHLGSLAVDDARFDDARSALFQALNLSDHCLEPRIKALLHQRIAELYGALSMLDRAAAHLDLAIESMGPSWQSKTYGRLLIERALLLIKNAGPGPRAIAKSSLEELVKLHTEHVITSWGLASLSMLAMLEQRFDDALKLANDALERWPAQSLSGGALLANSLQALAAAELNDLSTTHAALARHEHAQLANTSWLEQLWLLMPPSCSKEIARRDMELTQWRARLRELSAEDLSTISRGELEDRHWALFCARRSALVSARLTSSIFTEPEPTPLQPVNQPDTWVVSQDSAQLLNPAGALLQIHRPLLLRLMHHLVELRLEHPGEPIDGDALFGVGWPGERATAKSARNRLYAAIHTLRQDGFADLLKTSQDGGYLLDPSTPLVRQH